MPCPSQKQIVDFLYSGAPHRDKLQAHLQNCPLCQQRIQEEKDLTALFRNHFRTEMPGPFLWQRIEGRLATAPAPVTGFRTFFPRPLTALAASVILLIFVCSAVLVLDTGPSREAMLAAIDAQYGQTLAQFDDLDHNPFNGRLNQLGASDQNPFLSAEGTEEESDPATNPFSPFKAMPTKDIRR